MTAGFPTFRHGSSCPSLVVTADRDRIAAPRNVRPMLTRRRFVTASALTLAAGPALAQELVSAETPMLEDPGPLRLDIGPQAIEASLTLPPTVEGDYPIPDRYQAKVVQV